MEKSESFLTVPKAILVGSLMVSISILISGGVIKFGSKAATKTPAASPAAETQQAAPQPKASLAEVKDVFNKAQVKFGDVNKKLIVIEVADPSCPYCHIAAGKNPELNKQAGSRFTLVSEGGTYVAPVPELAKLMKEGKAAFAWIYTNGHGNGEMGTKAMYCANEKGKFWEVHDLLMSSEGYDLLNNTVKNDKTKSGDLANFFKSVLDANSLRSCLDSGKYDNRLAEDSSLAQSINISGTPGFYLNNTLFAGAYNYTEMESAVKSALGE